MATVERRRADRAAARRDDLDAVMTVMDSAFGDRFGEAWTRSQLAGILPMAGVSLIARARAGQRRGDRLLARSAPSPTKSELLLIAVLPSQHRRGVGRMLLDDFLEAGAKRRRQRGSISKSATAIRRSACIGTPVFRRLADAATIIMRPTASGSTRSRSLTNFS